MTDIIRPGSGIIYMKVGTHAQETLEQIVERKTKEIESAGYALWGYGGNTCHPRTMVQPFVKDHRRQGQPIYLCMEEMESRHFAEPVRAEEYSADGEKWVEIPKSVNVRGSRFALKITSLNEHRFELPLGATKVAVGPQMGRPGDRYVQGRVDKACLEFAPDSVPAPEDAKVVQIGLVAELEDPYAVFLRNLA